MYVYTGISSVPDGEVQRRRPGLRPRRPAGVARERGLQVGVPRKTLAALFMSCLWPMFGRVARSHSNVETCDTRQ